MRLSISLVCLFLGLLPIVCNAQASLASAIDELPPCALECLVTAIEQSPCQLTNQTCICLNAPLQANVETCVLKSCTLKQGLTTKNITQTTCGAPIRDRGMFYGNMFIILSVIVAAIVLLRIIYKGVLTMSELGLDDLFVFLTLLTGVPSAVIAVHGTIKNGLGRDIWTVPFENITRFVFWFYIMEILYFAQVTLLKLSLLFFYARIFPAAPVRRVIWATVIFNSLFGISFIIAGTFQCRPISYYWKRWDGEHKGTCVNVNALGWSNAAISIALDIWMLAIPISQLVHLKLAWKKKVSVALMFCVGTFVTVVSILRLQSLVAFASSDNPTWDNFAVTIWSTVEIEIGIFCACMPACRVILVRFFPKILGTTKASQYYGSGRYGNGKYGNSSAPSRKASKAGLATDPSSVVSNRSRSRSRGGDKHGVTITKTFEVQHGDRTGPYGDERRLVEMDNLSPGGVKERRPSEEMFNPSTNVTSPKAWKERRRSSSDISLPIGLQH